MTLTTAHASVINSIAFSPNRRLMLTASADHTARLWSVQSGQEIRDLPHSDMVTAATFLDDDHVVTADSKGILHVWNLRTGTQDFSRDLTEEGLVSLSFSSLVLGPNDELWCVRMWGGGVVLLDAHTLVTLSYVNAAGLVLSGTDLLLTWSGHSATVRRLNGGHLATVRTIDAPSDISAAALSTDASAAFLGLFDGRIERWDLEKDGAVPLSRGGHRGKIAALALSPDARVVATAANDGFVLIRDAKTGALLHRIDSPDSFFEAVAFLDDDRVAFGPEQGTGVILADVRNGRPVQSFGSPLYASKATISVDGRLLLTAASRSANLWDLTTGEQIAAFPGIDSHAIALTPTVDTALTTTAEPHDYERYLVGYDAATYCETIRVGTKQPVNSVAFSRDGSLLAAGSTLGDILIWETKTGHPLYKLIGHSSSVTGLTFLEDGVTLLSTSEDNTARLWDILSGEELWREEIMIGTPSSRDGRVLIRWNGHAFDVIAVDGRQTLLTAPADTISASMAPDGAKVAFISFAGRQRMLTVADVASGERSRPLALVSQFSNIAFLADTKLLVEQNNEVWVVDWVAGKRTYTFTNAHCTDAAAPFVAVRDGEKTEIWDAVTLRRKATIDVELDFRSFAASPDRRYVTTHSRWETSVWDLSDGRRVAKVSDSYLRMDETPSAIPALAIADGQFFTSEQDKDPPRTSIRAWQTNEKSAPRVVTTLDYAINSVDLAADSKALLVCTGDGVVHLLDRAGSALSTAASSCLTAQFSPKGTRYESHGLDNAVPQRWDRSGHSLPPLGYEPRDVSVLAAAREKHFIATAEGRLLRVWNTQHYQMSRIMAPDAVTAAAFVHDGETVIAASEAGTLAAWRAADGTLERTLVSADRIVRLDGSPSDKDLFASADVTGAVRLWRITEPRSVATLTEHLGEPVGVSFSSDGTQVLAASRDGHLRAWRIATGQLVATIDMSDQITTVAFSESWQAVVGTAQGVAHVVDLHSGRIVMELNDESGPVVSVHPLSGGIVIATAQRLSVWWRDGERASASHSFAAPIQAAHAVLDGTDFNIVASAGAVFAARFNYRGWAFGSPFGDHVSSAVWSDADTLTAGYSSGWVRRWNDAGELISEFRTGTSAVRSVAWFQDDKVLLTGSDDHTAASWDVASGMRSHTFDGDFADSVLYIGTAGAKRQFVIAASGEGALRLFSHNGGQMLCSLISAPGGEWLVATPDGLFDGSPAALGVIGWRMGETSNIVPLEAFFNDFYHPGLLADIVAGRQPHATIDLAAAVQLPGLRTMLDSGKAHVAVRNRQHVICFADAGVALQIAPGMNVVANRIGDYETDPNDTDCVFRKVLPPGFESLIDQRKRGESRRAVSHSSVWGATLYVLPVGISTYAEKTVDSLPYASASAMAIAERFQRAVGAPRPYARVVVRTGLTNGEITRASVDAAIAEIANAATPNDVMVLYLAGHGAVAPDSEMFYVITSDATWLTLRDKAISTAMIATWLRRIRARRVVLLLDTCQSGAAVEAIEKVVHVKQLAAGSAAAEAGVYVMSATTPLAYAIDVSAQRSAFADVFLESLRESATFSNAAKRIEQELPKRTITRRFEQHPLLALDGADVPLPDAMRR
ncbi:MAG: caspase family protein [Acidobacteria bacterium]|nr:caspase family protein [Acidobacteriota bacterium]